MSDAGFSCPGERTEPAPLPSKIKLPMGKRMVSVPCQMCSGDGKVKREMPLKVPLCRLEGGATGFVERE